MPYLAVLAHLPPFLLCQGTRLEQDMVRDAHLSQIVEEAQQGQITYDVTGKTQGPPQ